MSKECCKSCCGCNCHDIVYRGHSCKCTCRPEFKNGDWAKSIWGSKYLVFIIDTKEFFLDAVKCNGEKLEGHHKSHFRHYTLTADDLIPCPYCGGKMKILEVGTGRCWAYCVSSDGCCVSMPKHPTEHEAVADVLLLKMWKDGFER